MNHSRKTKLSSRLVNNKMAKLTLIAATLALLARPTIAQTVVETFDFGTLKSDNNGYSYASKMSADGRVITGQAETDSGNYRAYRHNEGDIKMTDLGTLRSDNGGDSWAAGISADGRVITGQSDTDSGDHHAYRHNKGDTKMTDLGTLKSDNSGYSWAGGISADGRVIVGQAETDSGDKQAFRHNEGDIKMTNLGTLKSDNSGYSHAEAVSDDGRVVVGSSLIDNLTFHAFRHNEGDIRMTDLGTLKSDNSGSSTATAVSANGRVVVGNADNDSGYSQAFRHNEGDIKMTALGTLKSDNSGVSWAAATSADGRVVVGHAETDSGDHQAYRHNEGDVKMTALGTLKSDNSGGSWAGATSVDGRVIVGNAETDSGDYQAYIHNEGNIKMTALGTLKSDNSGYSSAQVISADGRVVGGAAETDNGDIHATVWKLSSVNPTEPPGVTIVDKDNSHQAMAETGRRGFKVLDLYQSALTSLGDSRCQIDKSNYCVGVFSQLDNVSNNQRVATGLFGSLRFLPSESWLAGGAINFANHTRLMNNYDTRGQSYPGIALFTRYQQNRDNSGFNAELSGAFLKQDITITRDWLQNTEAGEGNSRIKGYQAKFATGYGIYLDDNTLITPNAALIYHNVERDGYTETRNAEFAGTYGHMGNKRTDLQVGIHAQHNLTSMFQLDGELGTRVKLNGQRDAFTGQIDYIGAYAYEAGPERTVNPYAQTGVNVALSANSTLRTNIGWQQTDYHNDALKVGLSYSYHW